MAIVLCKKLHIVFFLRFQIKVMNFQKGKRWVFFVVVYKSPKTTCSIGINALINWDNVPPNANVSNENKAANLHNFIHPVLKQ